MTNEISTELLIKEIMWENHQIDAGIAKYQEARDKKDLADTTGGHTLIKKAMPNTIAAVTDAYLVSESMISGTFKGKQDSWVFMISLLQAEQTALISLNRIFTHCQTPTNKMSNTTSLAKKIGEALNQQVKYENWKQISQVEAKAEGRKKSHAQWLIEQSKGHVNRKKVTRWEKKFDNYRNIDWGQDTVNIGMKMIDVVCKANPDLFNLEVTTVNRKTVRSISMTDMAWAQYEQTEAYAELQRPILLPTLIQPKAWTFVEGQRVEGGYYHIKSELFTRGLFAHTSGDLSAPSQLFLDAVNAVQSTAWKVNPYILMVIDMLAGTGAAKGGITQNSVQTTPSMDSESYDKMSKAEKKVYHANRNLIVGEIATARGRHSAFTRKLAIAHKMAGHEEFYFPHFADFRSRLYPMPSELTPQGDAVAKSLLMFAKGKRLGDSGLKWLLITAANTFGMDKESLSAREKWSLDNLEMLARVSDDPLTHGEWNEADEPLMFLAAAKEITSAIRSGSPADFISHLPCNQDGTCNGMQILSMTGRDQTGAEATNCTASDVRHDLYATVAASVVEILNRDACYCVISAEWASILGSDLTAQRSVVKRAVMTTPYGVTVKGIAKQLVNDRKCNGFVSSSREEAAVVMTAAILEAMTSVNGKALEIMGYLKQIASALADEGLPMTWYTPMGLKVTQAYNRTTKKEVKTLLGDVILQVEDRELGLDKAAQVRSIAPNFIHSLDAAMLQDTVLRMKALGHTDFSMIHDSYGVHAGAVEDLHTTLRQSAFDIFSVDILQEFHDYAQEQVEATLPLPPVHGDYDISEILSATYFFS